MNEKGGIADERKDNENNELTFAGAVGASAGGLEAISRFISKLPANLYGGSLIIVQHMSPRHRSRLVELLANKTPATVREAREGERLIPGTIWVAPASHNISVQGRRIELDDIVKHQEPSPSADHLMISLAESFKEQSVGILLSGTGSDGTAGLQAIKKAGGTAVVQQPDEAKYGGMPESAVQNVDIDHVLPVEQISNKLTEIIRKGHEVEDNDPDLHFKNKIIGSLAKYLGTDFSAYKSSTINRRLEKRLSDLALRSIQDYSVYVDDNPDELNKLFESMLIGVTTLFRDPEAFDALRESITPMVHNKDDKQPIRIWVPGCATGEEAYSLAILLDEIAEEEINDKRLQIFATDIHEKAIKKARKARFSATEIEGLNKERVEKYFSQDGSGYRLIDRLRSSVLFSVHDLTRQPPFLNLDLISCRNVLIYFDRELQKKIIPLFHYAINPNGYLFLGQSETVGSFEGLFESVDQSNKVYRRKPGANLESFDIGAFTPGKGRGKRQILPATPAGDEQELDQRIRDTFFQSFEYPYVVINESLDVLKVHGDVKLFLGLDEGMMNANIVNLINDELKFDLRSIVFKAIKQHTSQQTRIKEFSNFGRRFFVQIRIKPMVSYEGKPRLFLVIFRTYDDKGLLRASGKTDKKDSDQRVQELEHELETTREQLQEYIEELETSSEEMQALNEELQASNEELQASNEELETANEELQSTNEEMKVAYNKLDELNSELKQKDKDLREIRAQQEAMLNNRLQAFILLNQDLEVLRYNELATSFIKSLGRDNELDEEKLLTDYLPDELEDRFTADLEKAQTGRDVENEYYFIDANGKGTWYRVNFSQVDMDSTRNVVSVGLFNIDEMKRTQLKLEAREELLNAMLNTTSAGIALTNPDGVIERVNNAFSTIFGFGKDILEQKSISYLLGAEARQKLKSEAPFEEKTGLSSYRL